VRFSLAVLVFVLDLPLPIGSSDCPSRLGRRGDHVETRQIPRKRRLSRPALAAALVVTTAMATGCSSGSNASPATAGGSSATPSTSVTVSPSKSVPGYREFGLNDQEFTDHVERTQALIASCMAEAGFEYIPVDVQTIEAAQARVRTEPGYTRITFKQKWGLAVTTRFDHPVRDTGLGPQNLRIMNSLKGADREAYERTMWGDNPDADFAWTFDEEDFSETGGCTRKAVAQVFTPEQLKGTYVNPKDVLVENDPRIQKALRNWSKCMREHGYNYRKDQDEIIDEYGERLDELLDGDDPTTLTGKRLEALHKLQKEEIAVSLADVECEIKYADAVFREVEIEVFGRPVSG
jgi:hypothetical protein